MAARLAQIIKAARHFGIEIAKPSSGGSHYRATADGKRTYPIAAHNGTKTKIDDFLIGKFCKHFELDLVAFKNRL